MDGPNTIIDLIKKCNVSIGKHEERGNQINEKAKKEGHSLRNDNDNGIDILIVITLQYVICRRR